MRKTILFIFLGIISLSCFSQKSIDEKNKKYFIGGGYGVGTARWYSNFNSDLYDTSGTLIQQGSIKFKAQNPSRVLNVEVIGPITNSMRMGLGIAFEDYYLDKIVIQDKTSSGYLLFYENFTVNKIYVQAEFPIYIRGQHPWSLGVNTHAGYFSYSGLKRYNFFGTKLGSRFLVSAALVGDYEIFEKVYVFVMPNVEYKFFKTSPKERPTNINHNIINYSISAGLRINMYRGKLRNKIE